MTVWNDLLHMWDIVYHGCVRLFEAMIATYNVPLVGEVSILGLVFSGGITIFVVTAIAKSFLAR